MPGRRGTPPPEAGTAHPAAGQSSSMRDRIIRESISLVAHTGPTTFNARDVCSALGIAPSLVNYHFGSRDELLAECAVRAYEEYVALLWEAVREAAPTPESRIRAWILRSVAWQVSMRGWGVVLNYPTSSLEISSILRGKWKEAINDAAELNLANLLQLIRDVRSGTVTDVTFVRGQLPREDLLADVDVVTLTANIGWAVLGLSVWMAGNHLPSEQMTDVGVLPSNAIEDYIARLIGLARSG